MRTLVEILRKARGELGRQRANARHRRHHADVLKGIAQCEADQTRRLEYVDAQLRRMCRRQGRWERRMTVDERDIEPLDVSRGPVEFQNRLGLP